jgi:hypothetical protein
LDGQAIGQPGQLDGWIRNVGQGCSGGGNHPQVVRRGFAAQTVEAVACAVPSWRQEPWSVECLGGGQERSIIWPLLKSPRVTQV